MPLGGILFQRRKEDVPLVKFMYLVFTCMPGELLYATQVSVVVFESCIFER